jgi:hypothetical protein
MKGDIHEYRILQYFKKLWNKPNLNNDQISWKSKNREGSSIKLEELEETLKMMKNGINAGNDNINSEL